MTARQSSVRRYVIMIRWRGYRWTLRGIARHSADLLAGILDHIPAGARVVVRCLESKP